MNAIAFDTLKVAKRLRDAGFSEAQAESVTDAIRDGVTGGDIATKASKLRAEIKSLGDELRSEMRAFRAELATAVATLEARIVRSQAEILRWTSVMIVLQGAWVVTLVKLLPGN